jgi:hypothetical protein
MGFRTLISTRNFSSDTTAGDKKLISGVYEQMTDSRPALV